jgi:hypothetical protein
MPYAKKNSGSKPKKTKKTKVQPVRAIKNKLRDRKTSKAFKKANK